MQVEQNENGNYEISLDGDWSRHLQRLAKIYGMPREDVIRMMLWFAKHMAETRMLNVIDKTV